MTRDSSGVGEAGNCADVIVVGAGASGCVVAARLAEAGRDVVLLEAGPDTTSLPATAPTLLPLDAADPRVMAVPSGDVMVYRGVGAGGSGQVNGAAWVPAPDDVLATWPPAWAAAYRDGLTRAETRLRPTTVAPHGVARLLAERLGAPCEPARLAVVPDGARNTPWHAYRPDLAGARVRFDAQVVALLLEPSAAPRNDTPPRIMGVLLDDDDLRAPLVVLCAGALETGRLLRRATEEYADALTGTAARRLRRAGVAGCEHPEWLVDVPQGFVAESVARFGTGPGDRAPAGLLTARIPLRRDGRRLEVRPYALSFSEAIPGTPTLPLQVGIALLDPRTRVPVQGGFPDLGIALDVADAEALAAVCTEVEAALREDGRGDCVARRHQGWSQHLYGTAPLGDVADERGGIEGIDGLHVADASLLPPGLGAGPYASTFAVAEAVAAGLRGSGSDAHLRGGGGQPR